MNIGSIIDGTSGSNQQKAVDHANVTTQPITEVKPSTNTMTIGSIIDPTYRATGSAFGSIVGNPQDSAVIVVLKVVGLIWFFSIAVSLVVAAASSFSRNSRASMYQNTPPIPEYARTQLPSPVIASTDTVQPVQEVVENQNTTVDSDPLLLQVAKHTTASDCWIVIDKKHTM